MAGAGQWYCFSGVGGVKFHRVTDLVSLNIFIGENAHYKQSNNTVTQCNRIRTKAGSLFNSSPEKFRIGTRGVPQNSCALPCFQDTGL